MDIKGLGELLPKETIDKLYTDAFAPSAKQVGKSLEDAVKVGRLLLLPIQALGALQDRIEPMLDRIRQRVPEDKRINASPEVVGPALERMRYLPERSELWSMYEEVLTKSVDSEQAGKVHPSFSFIISQLSRDEAWLIGELQKRNFEVEDKTDLVDNRFVNRVTVRSEIPKDALRLPDQFDLYYAHLESLSLVTWPVWNQDPIFESGRQIGERRNSRITLTEFGRLFAAACIPAGGFENAND